MNVTNRISCFLCLSLLLMGGCAGTLNKGKIAEKEILTVYPDGSMVFKERAMNEEDVIIYPDGRGGERAAVKVRVPLHPDFYRDTIVVERLPLMDQTREAAY